jgi:hypothetical protein
MMCVVVAWSVQWTETTCIFDRGDDRHYRHDDVDFSFFAVGSNVFLTVVLLFYLAEVIHMFKNPNQTFGHYEDKAHLV